MSPRALRASSGSGSGQQRRFGAHRYLYSKTNGLVRVSVFLFAYKDGLIASFPKNCLLCFLLD